MKSFRFVIYWLFISITYFQISCYRKCKERKVNLIPQAALSFIPYHGNEKLLFYNDQSKMLRFPIASRTYEIEYFDSDCDIGYCCAPIPVQHNFTRFKTAMSDSELVIKIHNFGYTDSYGQSGRLKLNLQIKVDSSHIWFQSLPLPLDTTFSYAKRNGYFYDSLIIKNFVYYNVFVLPGVHAFEHKPNIEGDTIYYNAGRGVIAFKFSSGEFYAIP